MVVKPCPQKAPWRLELRCPVAKTDRKKMEKSTQMANTSALVCLQLVAGSECCFLVVAASSRWRHFHGSAFHMASLGEGEGAKRGRKCL